MKKGKWIFLAYFLLIGSLLFSQQNIKNAKFASKLKNKGETFTLYYKESNCESVTLYKYVFFKRNNKFAIQNFSPITYSLPKTCIDTSQKKINNYAFKSFRIVDAPDDLINVLTEAETLIRQKDKAKKPCTNDLKFTLVSGKSIYRSKTHKCGTEILNKLSSTFIIVTTKD